MLKIFFGSKANILLGIFGFLLLCLTAAILIQPELIGLGMFSLAFAPVADFYDQAAHNEEGSEIWWIQRINKTTDAIVTLGQVSGVKVTTGGSGYNSAPTVGFSGGGGTGAAGTALVSGGKVVKVVMTNNGTGYTSAPTVTFTPVSGGTGAAGTAFWSDGWHLGPGRAKIKFSSGREITDVIGESKGIFTTRKEPAKGTLEVESLQNDTWTKNFFGKEAYLYDWRVFQHIGPSRGEEFTSYRLIAKVRFPELTEEERAGGTIMIKGTILENKSALAVTNATDLPVANLVGDYAIAAKKCYSEDEEVQIPSV